MLVPFPSSCFSLIWDCHLFLYSLSHPPRYLPQPCSASHRFHYVLRTNRTVSMQMFCMNVRRDVKYPELVEIRSRHTIKCSPPSRSSASCLIDTSHMPGGNPEHIFFSCFRYLGGKITFLFFL